jgi:hypothetical protein
MKNNSTSIPSIPKKLALVVKSDVSAGPTIRIVPY